MTSMINTNCTGVIFLNHSEKPIHIRKDGYLGPARVLVFGDKVPQTKEFIDRADLIRPGATTKISFGSQADLLQVHNEYTLGLPSSFSFTSMAIRHNREDCIAFNKMGCEKTHCPPATV